MSVLDWLCLFLPLLIVLIGGICVQRHMKSVADFMSGGRVAGPYLLAVARGELQAGAVVFIAMFEMISRSGFTMSWWTTLTLPVGLMVALTGFVVYRYRETRAMTLAQFFEIRYSKRFRLVTGVLGFVAGVANFGIIPSIGARFLVHYLGFPETMAIFSLSIPTYVVIMGILLSITLWITLSGGLLTVMITDCIEGIISHFFYIIIIVALLSFFHWEQITFVLSNHPPGQSKINPFDSLAIEDFNIWFVLMTAFVGVYGTMAWQNASAFNSAAVTPHASVMGGILGRWRESGKWAVILLLAICAMTFLEHPDFALLSASAHSQIDGIADPRVRDQMSIPVAISHMLPIGIKGLFCALMIMGIFGGDSTHLHSWGGIFVQDVLVPLRKAPFAPAQHIKILRLSIAAVAVFAFLFGSLFRQTEYILMWWQVTMAIYVGGAGAAIIGGLYWKKGTTAGAWAALATGSLLSAGGIVARQFFGQAFPLNGAEIFFFSALLAIASYIVVSLITCSSDFDMERMLHRGRPASDGCLTETTSKAEPKVSLFARATGVDENFTAGDKVVAVTLFSWSMFWFVLFIVGTAWNLVAPWSDKAWSTYWWCAGIVVPVTICFVTAFWFSWGGVRDLRLLFTRLKARKINHFDDGTVVDHRNLDEIRPEPGPLESNK